MLLAVGMRIFEALCLGGEKMQSSGVLFIFLLFSFHFMLACEDFDDVFDELELTGAEDVERQREEWWEQQLYGMALEFVDSIVEFALEEVEPSEPIAFPKRRELSERSKRVKRLGEKHGVSQRDALRRRVLAKSMIFYLKKSIRTDPRQHGEDLKNSFASLALLMRRLSPTED
jgi:hypothetical protein